MARTRNRWWTRERVSPPLAWRLTILLLQTSSLGSPHSPFRIPHKVCDSVRENPLPIALFYLWVYCYHCTHVRVPVGSFSNLLLLLGIYVAGGALFLCVMERQKLIPLKRCSCLEECFDLSLSLCLSLSVSLSLSLSLYVSLPLSGLVFLSSQEGTTDRKLMLHYPTFRTMMGIPLSWKNP